MRQSTPARHSCRYTQRNSRANTAKRVLASLQAREELTSSTISTGSNRLLWDSLTTSGSRRKRLMSRGMVALCPFLQQLGVFRLRHSTPEYSITVPAAATRQGARRAGVSGGVYVQEPGYKSLCGAAVCPRRAQANSHNTHQPWTDRERQSSSRRSSSR